MAFHIGFELPVRLARTLDSSSDALTPFEVQIIKEQIRKNSTVIDSYLKRIDLFVNREKYPHQEPFIEKLRQRMFLLMEENDTFRSLLWRHLQGEIPSPALR